MKVLNRLRQKFFAPFAEYGSFMDEKFGETYRTVHFKGTHCIWMLENFRRESSVLNKRYSKSDALKFAPKEENGDSWRLPTSPDFIELFECFAKKYGVKNLKRKLEADWNIEENAMFWVEGQSDYWLLKNDGIAVDIDETLPSRYSSCPKKYRWWMKTCKKEKRQLDLGLWWISPFCVTRSSREKFFVRYVKDCL